VLPARNELFSAKRECAAAQCQRSEEFVTESEGILRPHMRRPARLTVNEESGRVEGSTSRLSAASPYQVTITLADVPRASSFPFPYDRKLEHHRVDTYPFTEWCISACPDPRKNITNDRVKLDGENSATDAYPYSENGTD
jgi:hypothetical protein